MKTALVLIILFSVFSIGFNLFRLFSKADQKERDAPNATIISKNRVIQGSGIDPNDVKYLYGVPVTTVDELEEWRVLKGFSDAICGHLSDLMRTAESGKCEDYSALNEQWNVYYSRLRALCIRHKLWNGMLNDHQIFYPTEKQLHLEENLRKRFLDACEIGIDTAYIADGRRSEVFIYLFSQPNKEAVRKKMIRALAGDDLEKKKLYRRVCADMVRDGILSERYNEAGTLVVKKKRVRKKAPEVINLEPSSFSPTLYSKIDCQMIYKIKHTVGVPENVDREGNRCEFTSLSRGERYYTSLQRCTCVAFENGNNPCKHMVALAKYLRYI